LREVQTDSAGRKYWSALTLPPRVDEDGQVVEREPGSSSMITLQWPPYFHATWLDRKDAVMAVREAAGKQQVMSQRTAVSALSGLFGTEVDDELEEIERDALAMDHRAVGLLDRGAPVLDLRAEDDHEGDDESEYEGEDDEENERDERVMPVVPQR
jgi:hypothetical protein